MIWTRDRPHRLFRFHYRVEIYVPGPRRAHGYYVLPVLMGDELVARLDLKADRQRGALVVQGAFAEPGYCTGAVAEATAAELDLMRDWLGLERVSVASNGDLSARLLSGAPGGRAAWRALDR